MKIKRLSLLLVLTMLLSLMTGIIPASAASGVDGAEKYEILTKLGFFDEKVGYAEKASVTRGEIITAIVNALPEERIATVGDTTGFTDVSTQDAIAQIAAAASSLKLLGNETEMKATSIATLDDASFIILNLLGYNTVAKGQYATFAASIGLTKGVNSTTKMSMHSLVAMLYNALDTDLLQQVFTNGETTMKTIPGETLMTEILKVRETRGMVMANEYAGILGAEPTHRKSVIINEVEYLIGKTGASDMIGTVIDFYYRVGENDNELLYTKLHDEKTVLEIEASTIQSYDPATMTYAYRAGETVRLKREKISRESDIIYNGKNIVGDFYNFQPEDGYVRLIDNDNDGTNEIAIIMDYVSVTVGATDIVDGTITDYYNPENVYKLDIYDDELTYTIKNNLGIHGKFQDIDRYHTIFIAQSQDKELTTIITSDDFIVGTVSSMTDEEIVINNVAYIPSDLFLENSLAENRSYGRFYFDPRGRVSFYESLGALGIRSGFITKAIYDPDMDSVMVTMFTENGIFERLYTSEKLYITRGNNYSAVIDSNDKVTSYTAPAREKASELTSDDPDVEHELLNVIEAYADPKLKGMTFVLYETNGKGEIKEMEFPASYNDNLGIEQNHDKNNVFRKESTASVQYKSGKFGYDFKQGASTKTYVIPADITNKEGFHVYTGVVNMVRGWGETAESISFKKNANSAFTDYVIEFGKGGSGTVAEYPIFIVQDVLTTLNEDDEIVKSVRGYWDGKEVTYELSKELTDKDLGAGDIFRACVTDEGVITKIENHMDYSRKAYALSGSFGSIYGYYFGKLYSSVGTKLSVTNQADPANVTAISQLGNCWGDELTAVYKFDTQTKTITTTSYTAAKSYLTHGNNASEVYMHFHYGDHREMVIYE